MASAQGIKPSVQPSKLNVLLDAIFEDPTNLQKNFLLLEEQTKVGGLRGASATLDRILLLDPEIKLARVLLAEVQFNLGNLATAETTLQSLKEDETTPPDMLARVETNLEAINKAQSPWRYSASFSVARGSAENPRGASASDTILLTDIEVTNDTSDESEAYSEVTALGQIQYQLESQTPMAIKATAVVYRRDYLFYNAGDLTSLQAMVEYQKQSQPTLSLGTKFNVVEINSETYSATRTGYLNLGQTFWNRLKLSLSGETSYANNFETASRASARDYNGESNNIGLTATTSVFGQPVSLSGGYKRVDTEAAIYQTTSRDISISSSWQFGTVRAAISGSREWLHYRTADPLISSEKREDVISSSSLSLSMPIQRAASLSAKATYSSSESSLSNYDKDSADFQMGFQLSLN